jgi:hypothetical protein
MRRVHRKEPHSSSENSTTSISLHEFRKGGEWGGHRRKAGQADSCRKMDICGTGIEQKGLVNFLLADNLLRGQMKLTWTLREGSEKPRAGTGESVLINGAFDHKYQFNVTSTRVGVHILQIMFDNVEVPASPILLEVRPFNCKDTDRVADDSGDCQCDTSKGYRHTQQNLKSQVLSDL